MLNNQDTGYTVLEGTHFTSTFWQGFAMALAAVNRSFDQPSIVSSVMRGYGVTMKMLSDSEVDAYDLKQIRKCMRYK